MFERFTATRGTPSSSPRKRRAGLQPQLHRHRAHPARAARRARRASPAASSQASACRWRAPAEEVTAIVGPGKHGQRSGHIPFTPRAKKILELALREALQLQHNYIGTEHILLGLIREGEGVAAQILRQHADLTRDPRWRCSTGARRASRRRRRRRQAPARWLRPAARPVPARPGAPRAEQAVLSATPAADITLSRGRPAGRRTAGRVAPPAARRARRPRLRRRPGAAATSAWTSTRPRRRCAPLTSPAPATNSQNRPAAAR